MSISEKINNGIDGVVGFFSPKASLKRRMYRSAIKVTEKFGAYQGASRNRLRSSWIPGGGSADEDIIPDLSALRERSRDLNRNDAHASGITSTMTTNVVGVGIKPQSRVDGEVLGKNDTEAKTYQKKAEQAWKKWLTFADAGNRMDFYEIQQLVDRQILENGEAIIIPTMIKDKRRPFALALQVLEADRLDTPPNKRGDKSVRGGVRIGENGEPVAYFIQKTHPGDYRFSKSRDREFIEIPARNEFGRQNVFHLFPVQRSGQTRGVPFFAPVLNYFKDLGEYAEAELVSARIAACFSLFITSEASMDLNNGFDRNMKGQYVESLEPGMIKHLLPGENITSFNPQRPTATFEPFVERMLRAISASLGLPYELVAKDFSKTNYSSARAALLEARRYFKVRQEWIARKLCQPVWEMVLEEAYLKGELGNISFYKNKTYWTNASWVAPGWEWVDPLKEAKASEVGLKNGIVTYSDLYSSQGKDWEECFEQRKREQEKISELGLNLGEDRNTNISQESDENAGDAEDTDTGVNNEE
ncbi:phage portal protein [bacterium]|jgi:capsid protein|nr:phage portal protein [bacterium]